MLIFIILQALLFTPISFGQIDLTLAASYRTYPIGGSAQIDSGYGFMLWGKSTDKLYGFTRMAFQAEGVENFLSTGAVVEIFPISVVGVRLGGNSLQNHLDYKSFDCSVYSCRGSFQESFIEFPLYLRYSRLLFSFNYRLNRWSWQDERDKVQFIEPLSGLPLSTQEKEGVVGTKTILLFELTEHFRLGGSYSTWRARADDILAFPTRQSEMWLGVLQYINSMAANSSLNFIFGLGAYRSTIKTSDPTFVVGVQYAPLKKIGY